jgi:C-terminal processing protease CtpA/Prc
MKISPQVILCLFIAAMITACGQSGSKKIPTSSISDTGKATQKLSIKMMHDDLFILWQAIKEMHPVYGIYTTADSLQRAYDKTYSAINEPLPESEFINRFYPFLCELRCGHTQIEHSAGYKPAGGSKEYHLPFEVLVRAHKAWITTHLTDKLNTGDEIISMNGIPIAEIIKHGYGLYCGDGYNETFKELFLSEYDGFEDVCNKYYHWAPPYQLSLRTKQGAIKTVSLTPPVKTDAVQSSPEKTVDNYINWTEAKNTGYLPLRFLKNSSTAWFVAKTYQYSDTVIYKEAFKQIHQHGIKNLILDMRHNTGGDIRVATKLLTFLADGPFHVVANVKSRIPNPAVNNSEKYFDTARTASFNQSFKPGQKEGTYYHVDFKPVFGQLLSTIAIDKTDHFGGRLFVLIDGATFSSAALFTSALKAQRKNTKFIGRETAGAEEGCDGGTIQHLTLPNTQIIIDFPWMRLDAVARKPIHGRGIIPDYPVNYTPEDVVSKNDPDLKKALSLIN